MATYAFHPNPGAQSGFLRSNERYPALIMGLGGGKTWAGTAKLLLEHLHFAGSDSLAIEPTYQLCKEVLEPALLDHLARMDVPSQVRTHPYRIETPTLRSCIRLHSGFKAERITGFQVGRALIDEPARIPEWPEPQRNAWLNVIARCREPRIPEWAWKVFLTGTHEGKGTWLYRDWEQKPRPGHVIHRGSTDENPTSRAYAEIIAREFGVELAEQYLHGRAIADTTSALPWAHIEAAQAAVCTTEPDWEALEQAQALYVGMDIGRTRSLDVYWVLEMQGTERGKPLRTAAVIVERDADFAHKARMIDRIMETGRVVRLAIDATFNPQTTEDAAYKWGRLIVPVVFSEPKRIEVIEGLQKTLAEATILIPDDETIAADLASVKRVVGPTGRVRYFAPMTADGHADRFFALALAVHALKQQPSGEVEVEIGPRFEATELTEVM